MEVRSRGSVSELEPPLRSTGPHLTPPAPGSVGAQRQLSPQLRALVSQAILRQAQGLPAVPFHRNRPPFSGRAFGVELEFQLPFEKDDPRHAEALQAIGAELHKLKLTGSAQQLAYHHGKKKGYSTRLRRGWTFEEDGTVAGELVSPILRDEPGTWESIEEVLGVLRKHGAIAGQAGLHVHVSVPDYGDEAEPYTRLATLVSQHQPDLTKVATQPERGEHRGVRHCKPNDVPAEGYATAHAARSAWSHDHSLDFKSADGGKKAHLEHRLFDASLDPGVIQAQVKLSQALTEAGRRGVDPARGEHRFEALLRALFPDPVDFEQVATLYALNFHPGCPLVQLTPEQAGWFDAQHQGGSELEPLALFKLSGHAPEERKASLAAVRRLRHDVPRAQLNELMEEPQTLAVLGAQTPARCREYAALRAIDAEGAARLLDRAEAWGLELGRAGASALLQFNPETWDSTWRRARTLIRRQPLGAEQQARVIQSVGSLSLEEGRHLDRMLEGSGALPRYHAVEVALRLALGSSEERQAGLTLFGAFGAPAFRSDLRSDDQVELAALLPHLSARKRLHLRTLLRTATETGLRDVLDRYRERIDFDLPAEERARRFERAVSE
jgi:hypothetical protein